MTLWLVFALMTAAAIFAVLWPLARNAPLRSGNDRNVYRDQLEEIGRDREAGRIGDAEAEAARLEVARRLLAAANATDTFEAPNNTSPSRRRAVALAALILVPVGGASLYLTWGSPFLPDAPLSARLNVPGEQSSIETLVVQVEAHLERNPQDGRGWEVLAPVYARLGRLDDAVKAWRNALGLLGASSEREADLGEALVAAANGIVTAEAKQAFESAAVSGAGNAKAKFFLGLAAEQDGKHEAAAGIWRALLASAPADAPYRELLQSSLTRVERTPVVPGPSSDDIATAEALSPDQRNDMIQGMVARLAERLKSEGSDFDGWLRLVRAYMVLGERDKARAAASDARRAIGEDADKRRRLDELVKGLGLEG
jgi:cytochrome c-type biogenesis protein CcmH